MRIWCFHFQLGDGDLYNTVPSLENCLAKSSLGLGGWKSFFLIFFAIVSQITIGLINFYPSRRPMNVSWSTTNNDFDIWVTMGNGSSNSYHIHKYFSSGLVVSILFVLQCITTNLIDFGNTISLMHHKRFQFGLLQFLG